MAAPTLVVFAIVLIPLYLGGRIGTVPEYLERRFDRRVRRYFSALTLISNIVVDTASTLFAGALVSSFGTSLLLRMLDVMGKLQTCYSVCPRDCPSQCPVEIEHIDAHTTRCVYGTWHSTYHTGVACAKVAYYAERVHHSERLATPLRRVEAKDDPSASEPISWDPTHTPLQDTGLNSTLW